MSLTDTTIKNAKPTDKPYKIADDKGMFLLVNSNGSKSTSFGTITAWKPKAQYFLNLRAFVVDF